MRNAVALSIACIFAAGCGSSGHAGSVTSMPRPVPTSTAHMSGGRAVFVIKVPKAKAKPKTLGLIRRAKPQYISQSTQSISIATNGGSPFVANLTPSSPNCVPATQNTPLTCTLNESEPIGTDTFVVTTYDQIGAAGNALSTATVQASIVAGVANTVDVTLNGIVESLGLALNPANPPLGTVVSVGLSVNAMDADGNIIESPGSYVDVNGNPVTITLSDTDSMYTSLSQSTVTSPAASVSVNYNGGPLTSALFAATTGTISTFNSEDAILTPSSGTSVPVVTPQTVSTNGTGDVNQFSVSEQGYGGTFSATPSDPTICTVMSPDGINFTVTGAANPGLCTITVLDANNNPADVFETNTVTTVSFD